ncbi:MAG: pH-gated potassium channel KcsA [Pseudomonadota bacterium]|jgi:voltage-gated potassium channel
MESGNQASRRHHLVRRGLLYSLALVLLIMVLGGVGFWLIDPRIHSLADGLWLAFTTAATVGYGDLVPSTHASRAFSVLVVLLGLAVLSLVTASLAAIFVEQEVESEERQLASALLAEVAELRAEVAALRAELAAGLSSAHAPETPEEPSRPALR